MRLNVWGLFEIDLLRLGILLFTAFLFALDEIVNLFRFFVLEFCFFGRFETERTQSDHGKPNAVNDKKANKKQCDEKEYSFDLLRIHV